MTTDGEREISGAGCIEKKQPQSMAPSQAMWKATGKEAQSFGGSWGKIQKFSEFANCFFVERKQSQNEWKESH